MPVSLHRSCKICSVEVVEMLTPFANPGDDLDAWKMPEFMRCAVESLEMVEENTRKPRPPGLNEDLFLDSTLASPFFAEAIKKAWFIYIKRDEGTLVDRIRKLKENVESHLFTNLIIWCEGMKELSINLLQGK